MSKFTFDDFPATLQKKVTLLEHFKQYLQSSDAQQSASKKHAEQDLLSAENRPPAGSVYVKKWMRTRHAIMFRLSNKIV